MSLPGETPISQLPERDAIPSAEMPNNELVVLQTGQPIYDSMQIGIEPVIPGGSTLDVVGEFNMHDAPEDASIAIVREGSTRGLQSLWMVGIVKDAEGKPSPGGWVEIKAGIDYTVGRGDTKLSPGAGKIGGEDLFKKDFSFGISSGSLKLRAQNMDLHVINTSANGIGVRGAAYVAPETSAALPPPDPEKTVGSDDTQPASFNAPPGFIDNVPTTAEAGADWKQQAEAGRIMAIEAAKAAQIAPLQEHLKRLVAGLSEDDKNYLKHYADAEVGQRLAQREGNGKGAKDEEERKGWYLQRLTPAARRIVGQYAETTKAIDKITYPDDYK